MTLPDLNKKMSMFRIGRVILCQKPLWHNGFWLSYYRGPMSPNKYKQGKIKTQNAQSVESEPQLCHWDTDS